MKKNTLLIAMGVVTVASLCYAGVKHFEADRQSEIALRALKVAEESKLRAEAAETQAMKARNAADASRSEAMRQRELAAAAMAAAEKRK